MIKGLYIHIPFCEKICIYCDFPKLVANSNLQDEYVDSLIRELRHYHGKYSMLQTIYIGGGTPSFLSKPSLERLLIELNRLIGMRQIEEFTLEANPNNIDIEFLNLIKEYGVNRISLGVQTINDAHLDFLHRTHTSADIREAVRLIRQSGFLSFNLDFIYALPDQTLEDVKMDLAFIEEVRPPHISFYSLIIEERTEMIHLIQHGKVQPVDADLEADMQEYIEQELEHIGYHRYEISNYCLPGYQSKHNLLYWDLEEYLGVGMAAASQYDGTRWVNPRTIRSYSESIRNNEYKRTQEDFSPEVEYLLMGLRKTQGIDLRDYEKRFGGSPSRVHPRLEQHLEQGLLEVEDTHLRFTRRGMSLSNQVYLDII